MKDMLSPNKSAAPWGNIFSMDERLRRFNQCLTNQMIPYSAAKLIPGCTAKRSTSGSP